MKNLHTKLIVLSLSMLIFVGLVIHFYWLDGIVGAFCELVFGDTEYSQGYREYKFRRIQKGMTETQVIAELGEPLFKNPHGPNVWFYTYGKRLGAEIGVTDSNYTERVITFTDGVVSRIHHNFYFD